MKKTLALKIVAIFMFSAFCSDFQVSPSSKPDFAVGPFEKKSPINYTFIEKIGFRNDDYRWFHNRSNSPTLDWIISLIENKSAAMDFAVIPTSSCSISDIETWSKTSINFWNNLIDNDTFGLVIHSWNHSKRSPTAYEMNYTKQYEYINKSKNAFLQNLGWFPQGYVESWENQNYTTSLVVRDLGFYYLCGNLKFSTNLSAIETHKCEIGGEAAKMVPKGFESLKKNWLSTFGKDGPYDVDYTSVVMHTQTWTLPTQQAELNKFIDWINENYVNTWKAEWMTNWEYHMYIADRWKWTVDKVSESEYIVGLNGMKYSHTVRWDLAGDWKVYDISSGGDIFIKNLTVVPGKIPFDTWQGLANHVYKVVAEGIPIPGPTSELRNTIISCAIAVTASVFFYKLFLIKTRKKLTHK